MRTAFLLFGFGLALRLLFWLATGDRWDVHAAAFQGDAPVWQELARAAAAGEPHLLFRLPLRPPAMHWLVSAVWDGDAANAWVPRVLFAGLGALVAPLCWLLLRRHLSTGQAVLAGVLIAAATPLLLLGSGPHSELPYLVAVLLTFFDQERLRDRPRLGVAARWGAVHGLLCLLRAEHALTFLALGLLLLFHRRGAFFRPGLAALAGFSLSLLPWHVVAWQRIDAYNATEPSALRAPGPRVPGFLPWSEPALARLSTLPKSQQRPVFHFVTATVAHRGRRSVDAGDLDLVREAYGVWPEPLPHPFVCLYGGLNFFLANSPEANGGFSSAALDRPPPLASNPERFPPGWETSLPRRGTFSPDYLPHLGRLLHGYRDGLREVSNDPAGAFARLLSKVGHFVAGAASGLGGYSFPVGLSGLRPSVDLVAAEGRWATGYRVALLSIAALGLWSVRRQPWLWPWLVFALTKLATAILFFGYARQGALCAPLVMLGVAVAVLRRGSPRAAWILAAILFGAEIGRTLHVDMHREEVDGRPIPAGATVDHRPIRVLYD